MTLAQVYEEINKHTLVTIDEINKLVTESGPGAADWANGIASVIRQHTIAIMLIMTTHTDRTN